jgi:hypothetical protein
VSQSDYNDGRLLRSDDTILALEEVRMLLANLESGSHTESDLEMLQSVSTKLEGALGEYYTRVEAATTKSRQSVLEGTDPGTAQMAMNIVINQLDMQFGQPSSPDIIINMDEWKWIKDRWKINANFSGSKVVRTKLLRISNVIREAKGVKFVGASVWVKGEDAPRLHSNGSEGSASINEAVIVSEA